MASAQAQIEVVVKNLRSLDKIERALTKITSQNDKLIASLDKVVGSLSNIEKAVVGVGKASTNSQKQLAGSTTQTTKLLKGQVSKWYGIKQAVNSILGALGNVGLAAFNFNKEMMKTWQLTMKLQKFKKNLYVDYFAESKAPLSELTKIISNLQKELSQYHSSQMRLVGGDEKAIDVKNQLAGALREQSIEQARINNLLREAQGITQLGPGGKGRGFGSRFVNTPEMESAKARDRSIRQRAAETRQARMIADGPYKDSPTGSAWSPSLSRESQRLIKLDSEFKNLPTVKAVRQLKAIEQKRLLIHKRNLRASEKLNKMAQAQGMVGSTGFTAAQYGPQPLPLTMAEQLGFGQKGRANPQGVFASRGGMGGRVRGAGSSALIGGAFPFLFGQGGASAAGGALGGAAGGFLGGGLGFGLSLVGTAIGSAIEKFDKLNEKIAVANGRMKAMGFESEFTRQEIEKMAKSLKITKDEAVQAASTFARFGKERALTLGGFFGADTAGFDAVAKVRDQASALAAIQTLSKDISFEKQKELIALVRTNTAAQIQIKLQTVLLEVQQLKKIELIKEISLREKILNITRRTWNVISQFTTPGLMIAGETPGQRVERQLKEAEEQFAKMKALIDGAMAEIGSVDTNINLISNFDKLPEVIRQTEAELIKLEDPMFQVIEASKAISGAFKESFREIISGTTSVQEAFARMFQRIADHFLDMAAQMAATQLQKGLLSIFSNFGSPSVGTQVGNMIGTFGEGGHVANGIKSFSTGGLVTRPTIGLVGEAGEDEYIIPSSKMQGAMERYSAGARGQAVIPGGGTVASGSGVSSAPTTVNYTGPVLSFNSEAYVPKSAIPEIINSAARRGAEEGQSKVFSQLKNSRSRRSTIGL